MLFLELGPLILIGVVFLLGYSLLFMAAAALAGLLWRRRDRAKGEGGRDSHRKRAVWVEVPAQVWS